MWSPKNGKETFRKKSPSGNEGVAAPSTGEQRIVRANLNREVAASDDYVSLYANDTQIQTSPWDIPLIFGLITSTPSSPDDLTIRVKLTGEVRMSPQHAKRVAMILIQQLQNYERNMGPIPQPSD